MSRPLPRGARFAIFPVGVTIVFFLLCALQLNQSSVALIEPQFAHDPGLIAGAPHQIRSDEFNLSTPATVGNALKGFPSHQWLGINSIALDATSLGAPVLDWTAAFSPQSWGLLLVGRDGSEALAIGFAWHWWFPLTAGLLGVYALLVSLRPRPLLAATLSMVIALSPYVAWWSDSPGFTLGLVAGAGGVFIIGLRSSRWIVTLGCLAAAAWLTDVAFFGLYPPWLISVGLVVALVVVGAAVDDRISIRKIAAAAALFAVAAGAAIVAWRYENSAAISAIQNTYYPGQRQSIAGEGSWSHLLSAPLNFFMASHTGALIHWGGLGQNLSEASSVWFPVTALVFIGIAMVVEVVGGRRMSRSDAPEGERGERWYGAAAGASASLLILLAWAMMPLPGALGHLGLSLIPGYRTYLALGLAAVLVTFLSAGRLHLSARVWVGGSIVAIVAAVPLTWLAARAFVVVTSQGLILACLVAAVISALVLVLVFVAPVAPYAAIGLAAISLASFVAVGPLYQGLGPLTSSKLARYLAHLDATQGPSRWVTLDYAAGAIISGSPNSLVSGMTYYPDAAIWDRLAPSQRSIWNNYLEINWIQDPHAKPVRLASALQGSAAMYINLCSPKVAFLDIQYVLATGSQDPQLPCYRRIATLRDLGTVLYIYRNKNISG